MSTGCSICDDKIVVRAVDEELERGLTYTGLSRLMTARGFPFSECVISKHDKHRVKTGAPPEAKLKKRDLALLIRDRVHDTIESDENLDVFDKDVQGAMKTGLGAQALIDKREQKKVTQNFWIELYTGQQGEVPQLDDGMTITGEAVVVE